MTGSPASSERSGYPPTVAMSELGLYVYGLVPARAWSPTSALSGIDDGHSVRLIVEGNISAIVSEVGLDQFGDETLRANLSDMSWVEHTARQHQRVLDEVIGQCTPIPMRMCTVYTDEAGLRRMLAEDHHALADALRELDARLEWGVKAFQDGTLADSPGPTSRAPAATTGTAYLQTRLAQRNAGAQRQAELEIACDEVHGELCAIAVSCRLNPLQRPEVSGRDAAMVMNGSYLVANESRALFTQRFTALRDESAHRGLELELTGPWPPYNFVPAVIGGGL